MRRLALGSLVALIFVGAARADDLVERGRTLFEPCSACHAREPGKTGMAGPALAGLKGRRVGGAPEFDYSPVLQRTFASGAVWDEARLLEFLADPEEMFPGMWMSSRPIANETDRQALAAYLLQGKP